MIEHLYVLAAAVGNATAEAGNATAGENPAQALARQFGWEPRLFFSQVILFIIVAFALKKLAYDKVLQTLHERKTRIAEGLHHAQRMQEQLTETQKAHVEVITQASTQATKLIEEAREHADRSREEQLDRAKAEAAEIVRKAQEAIAGERAKMLAELKREVGRLVVETTVKVAGKVLTAEDQRRLIEQANKELAA